MIREYVRAHRSAVLTTAVSIVVGAVVAGTAIVSTGYHTQRVDLGDGTVWVPSAEYGAVGRANTSVLQLNTAVETASDTLSVLQDGGTVYSVDETKATVAKVDVADATVGDPVTLPSGSPRVYFSGDTTVIGNRDTGQLWSTPTSELDQFDASTKADLTLGADAVFDADDTHVAAYSPRTSTAALVDVGTTLSVDKRWSLSMDRKHDFQTAVVGSHLAVLDRTDDVLAIDGKRIDLGDAVSGTPALQRSGSGSDVVVASAAGVARVSPSGTVERTALSVSGNAARPYVASGCTFGAWAGGQGWNSCDGRAVQRLASMPGGADLSIEHNGDTVVANDPDTGRSWAIDRSGQLIDNWSDLIQRDDEQQQEQTSDDDPEVEKDQVPPVAVDDDLGARPGRTTRLPVLLNDYDPNGDPIVVDSVSSVPDAAGSVEVIEDGQALQIALPARASGTVRFDYEISDGNGGTAKATVTVSVHQTDVNGPPRQVRDTSADVVQNGHVSTDVLGDWVDPDGDPVYLDSATAPSGDDVSTTPDGTVDYRNTSGRTGDRSVQLVVSDGRDQGRGTLKVTVAAQGKAQLHADSFPVRAYAGKALTVKPLEHVRGGNGTVTLTSVPAVQRATVVPSYDAGTFRFTSSTIGDHQIEYTVTDGTKTASGIVRVTVVAPPDASAAPVTTPKTVFVQTLSTKDTDVTATDTDPAGGVLLVTGLTGLDPRSGVQASVLDQHTVRVTLTAPLDGPVTFSYQETNGLASATGSVTVIEIPKPDRVQPPVAQADSAVVRVGDVATIDVLANDSQPDGEPLTLEPDLVQNVPADAGLLFVSGDSLRYLAPETPGNYTAVYRIAGPDGQTADAAVSISVRERDASTNQPPVPETITARVVAGQSVRISVPLADIDPDGDSVQLVGVASNPDKGSVSDVTGDSMVYEAGDYSAGTDEFTYTVVDALGARATGTVRVGIAPRANQASNPVAEPDHVTIRPGGSVTVRVLQNDSDPDGGDLTVSRVEPNAKELKAKIVRGEEVKVTPPSTARNGDFAVLYTVENATGGASTAFLTVTVDPDAAPLRPEVDDTTLDLQDILHRDSVTVDVLKNVFYAEGTTADLRVGLVTGYTRNVSLTDDDQIVVRLTNDSQVIPFRVAVRDHPDIVAYGFIHVPGFSDALPQVNRTAPALSVKSESTLRIPLSKYVVTANGETATITDPSTVKATHANGADLVSDDSTLVFTSAKLYYGNASISFEVTDGSSANGGKGRTATLVLPIKVLPRENQPPSFTGTTIEMQPGDSRSFDLTRLTNYPYPKDVPELRYQVSGAPSGGVTATISGQTMTVKVADTAQKNTSATIGVSVSDATNQGRAGSVSIGVVASTRPLAQPAADQAVTKRGGTTTVDVLANDAATNPFPGEPLKVVAIRGLSGGIPSGVSITPSADKSRLQVSVSDSAKPQDTHLQYQVADATNDPDRYVWGDITISVQDVPDPPSAPTRTGSYDGGQITLGWNTPQANNSPITGYRVTGNGVSQDCGLATVCTISGLDPKASYRFQVVAVNAIGTSDPSPFGVQMSADYVPDAPEGLQLQASTSTPNELDATWKSVPQPGRGSAVDNYVVTLTGPTGTVTRNSSDTSEAFQGLTAGGQYSVSVSARNDAGRDGTQVQWNSAGASGVVVGRPSSPSVRATVAGSSPGSATKITVSASVSDWQGGNATSLEIRRLPSGTNVPSFCDRSVGTIVTNGTDTPGGDGADWTYFAYASNGSFCSVGKSDRVSTYLPAGDASATYSTEQTDDSHWSIKLSSFAVQSTPGQSSSTVDHYEYRIDSGSAQVVRRDVLTVGNGYNTASSISVRACRDAQDQYCGPWSADSVQYAIDATPQNVEAYTGEAIAFALPSTSNGVTASVSITVNGSATNANDETYANGVVIDPGLVAQFAYVVTVTAKGLTFSYSDSTVIGPRIDPGTSSAG